MKLKILYDKPLVIYVPGWYMAPKHSHILEDFLEKIKSVNAFFIYSPAWNLARESTVIFEWLSKITKPKHKWIVACNDYFELKFMRDNGVEAFLAPQSCFLDENVYNVSIGENKKLYDAIYNAQMLSFKRHHLLKDIKNCALVTYGEMSKYAEQVLEQIKEDGNIHLINKQEDNKFVFINWRKLIEVYAASYVGLCLSEQEGAMYASVEYLLCGIPIVTTLSKGGRDYYFDGRYVIHCDSTPESVAESVEVLKFMNLDPHDIRKNTLEKMYAEREKFVEYINGLLISEGVKNPSFSDVFKDRFSNKLLGEVIDRDELVRNILSSQ